MAKKVNNKILRGILTFLITVGAILGCVAFILHFVNKEEDFNKASGGNASTVSSMITKDMWGQIFPNQNKAACKTGPHSSADILSYDNFIKACAKFPKFGKTKIEIAAFLANMTQETYGGWKNAPGGELEWGGCFGSEVGCYTGEDSTNCKQYNTTMECTDGKNPKNPNNPAGYYGRGPLQLSYCANYQAAGTAIGQNLANNPNILVNDGVAAFEASLWYWMTFAQGSCCNNAVYGTTCHQVMNEPHPDFTKTIAILNGGIECGIEENSGLPYTEFLRRNRAFQRICGFLGITPIPPCGTTCNKWADNGKCYEKPSGPPGPPPGPPQPPGSTVQRCGKTWADANSNCNNPSCETKDDCTDLHKGYTDCYAGVPQCP